MKGILLGTGPSITPDIIRILNRTTLPIFGCNNAYQIAPLHSLMACNIEWWDYYWPIDRNLRQGTFKKWTWDKRTADKYGINHIEGKWADSLSTDPKYLHLGHSAGFQNLGIAYHAGIRIMYLVGYDLKYPKGYDGKKQITGGERHYFGEYPKELQHWTKFNIGPNGELNGLLDCYRTIDCESLGLRIINTNPDSALDFFEVDECALSQL